MCHFERWSKDIGIEIQEYHGENVIFTSRGFEYFLFDNTKTLTLCRIENNNKNGGAEKVIPTVVWKAIVMMIHEEIIWPDNLLADLWTISLKNAAHLHNTIPRYDSFFAEAGKEEFISIEIFAGIISH